MKRGIRDEEETAIDFLTAWFNPRLPVTENWGVTIGNTRNGIHSYRKTTPASVTQTLEQWIMALDNGMDGFLNAMGRNAFVYPLWTVPSTRLLTENNYLKFTVGTPGFWFDIPEISPEALDAFLSDLNRHSLNMQPSMVTGKATAGSSVIRGVRLWWPLPEDNHVSATGINIVRLAHGRLMRRRFMEFNADIVGELLPARPNMHELSYRLPGSDEYQVLTWKPHNQAMSYNLWMHFQMLADEHSAEWNEVMDDLSVPHRDDDLISAQSQVNALTWDAILTPAGWTMSSMGSDPWVSYWTASGVPDLVVAHTDKEHLTLHTAHWATRLINIWDLGIPLTKWVVAAVLAADGNGVALADRYLKTGRIY